MNAAGAIAAIAAQYSACFWPRNNVPAPPIEWPMRYIRFGSMLNWDRAIWVTVITSSSLSSVRLAGSGAPPPITISGDPYQPTVL